MKTPDDVVRDLFTTFAHIERDSDEKITAESLYFLATRAVEADRAQRHPVLTIKSEGLRYAAATPDQAYAAINEMIAAGHFLGEIEWETA